MGVQGLWSLVGPAARPTQLEMLRNRKLAIDASIWIYQFIRSMRDKEGYPVRNAHLLGFFRRLCKLLFYNIKPVFVFDGGVPVLKLSTIVSLSLSSQQAPFYSFC
jgi:DNA excision repair protein ERCC-5